MQINREIDINILPAPNVSKIRNFDRYDNLGSRLTIVAYMYKNKIVYGFAFIDIQCIEKIDTDDVEL